MRSRRGWGLGRWAGFLGFSVLLAVGLLAGAAAGSGAPLGAPTAGLAAVQADTPAVVSNGQANLQGDVDPSRLLRLNVGLAVRDSAGLDALIRQPPAREPHSTGTT